MQNPDGSFTYTPNAGFYGTDTIHFIAKDGQFLASDDFTITVTTNPVIAAVVGDDLVVTGNLLANDANPNDAIVNVQLGATAGNTFTVDGLYGELVVDANGHYTYTLGLTSVEKANLVALGDGHSAQDVFTYTISDGTVSSNANLVVDVTNHVPTISIAPAIARRQHPQRERGERRLYDHGQRNGGGRPAGHGCGRRRQRSRRRKLHHHCQRGQLVSQPNRTTSDRASGQ